MTDKELYDKRIEAVKAAIMSAFPPDAIVVLPANIDIADLARAADAATLQAIAEPTPDMIEAGAAHKEWGRKHFGDLNYAPSGNIYRAMHAAIPRADK